ncbi:hypothetical protein FACS1894162_5350 [Bacteroidia bacterium]|nr:hypothetical protein FACS1894162_5350 [Bacteroidia bacterium]
MCYEEDNLDSQVEEFGKKVSLNDITYRKLLCKGVFVELFKDKSNIETNNIYFNLVWTPASKSKVDKDIQQGSHIISIEANIMNSLCYRECVALLLHEIGHIVFDNSQNEFIADNYAVGKGFKKELISLLGKCLKLIPDTMDNELTKQRINNLTNQK